MRNTYVCLSVLASCSLLSCGSSPTEAESLRIGTFSVDATPPIGSPVAYAPARSITDPLSARGIVLLSEDQPIVLCAVDWIGIGNGAHDAWREALAEAAGTSLYEGSPVTALEGLDAGDAQVAAETPGGKVVADHLILCGNAYLGDLVPQIRRLYVPVGSYIVATEPLGADRAAQVIPADCAVFDSNHILNYYRLSADGRLLFGGRTETSPLREPDPKGFLGARIRDLFPQIADANIDYAWGGTLAMTYSRMPQVGRLGSRVTFAQGYSGEGVAMSGLVGQVLAEAVAGQMERFDQFDRLPHRAFPGGRLLQKPALMLGLLWYRLCDLMP